VNLCNVSFLLADIDTPPPDAAHAMNRTARQMGRYDSRPRPMLECTADVESTLREPWDDNFRPTFLVGCSATQPPSHPFPVRPHGPREAKLLSVSGCSLHVLPNRRPVTTKLVQHSCTFPLLHSGTVRNVVIRCAAPCTLLVPPRCEIRSLVTTIRRSRRATRPNPVTITSSSNA